MKKPDTGIKYGLDLGAMIKKVIENHPTLTQNEIAENINIGRQGMYHRLNNPTYGTVYDLIEISLLLKRDFISPVHEVIKNGGIYEENKYGQSDLDLIQAEAAHYKLLWEKSVRDMDLLHKLIDKTPNKRK